LLWLFWRWGSHELFVPAGLESWFPDFSLQIGRITGVSHSTQFKLFDVFYLIYLFFFDGTGVWTEGLALTKQTLYCLSHISNLFCCVYFGDGVSWTVWQGWPPAGTLPISASQVARITGMSHWHLVWFNFVVNSLQIVVLKVFINYDQKY
jgi:hypothetical protein